MHIDFIEIYHKQKTTSLRQLLEEEGWQPADIPFSYLTFFNLFFDPSHDMKNEHMEETENTEEILKSSRPSYRGVINQLD